MKFERSSFDSTPNIPWHLLLKDRFSDLLPYESFDPKTKLFWNRGSVGFVLKGSPIVGSNLEEQCRIADFLKESAHLPENSSLQVLLWASPILGPLLNFWKNHRPVELYNFLAQKRVDFLSKHAFGLEIQDGSRDEQVLRDFRLFISFSLPVSSLNAVEEESILETRRALMEALQSIRLFMSPMNAEELVQDMSDFLHPGRGIWPEALSFNESESLRKQMVRTDVRRIVTNRGIVHEKTPQEKDPWILRCFVPRKWPKFWSLPHMGSFCGDLLGSTAQLPTPFWVHYGLTCARGQGKEKAVNTARRETLESQLKGRLTKWIPDLEEEYGETQEAVEEIQKGSKVILSQLCVGILSPTSQSTRAEQCFRSLWSKLGFEFMETTYDHLLMHVASCPMAWSWKEKALQEGSASPLVNFFSGVFKKSVGYTSALFTMGLSKKTLTKEAQNLLPILGEWKGQAAPGMLLYGRRGQVFFWNPFGSALLPNAKNVQTEHNYNVCIAGQSGSGKSVFMNEMMENILGIGGKVFVLDFGRSFKKTCLMLGGQHIEFDVGTPMSLNPFTHIPEGEDAESTDLRENLLSTLRPVFQVMAAPTHGTTDLQNSFLEQAIRACWQTHKQQTTVTHVFEWLTGHDEEIARHLGQMLFSFSEKGNYGRFFSGPATARFDDNLVVIETDQLRNHPDLMAVLVQMMVLQINQSMANGDRKTPFLIMIDEAWKLLQGKDSAAFISQATRTARKYKGSIVLATQHLTDYFKEESPAATEAFNCSAWKCILYQEGDVIESLGFHPQLRHFVENESQKRLLKSIHSRPPHYSEVAIFGPQIKGVIGRLKLDPFSRILYSTNPEEYQRVEAGLKKGLSIQEAIEAVLNAEEEAA